MRRAFGVALVLVAVACRVDAASFTLGNIAVLRAEENDSNTPASIVELTPGVAAQVPSNVIAIPGAGATNLRFSGSATSTGYLSHTSSGKLTFTGVANQADTTANANTLNPRGVGTLNAAGTFNVETTYTGTSGNQTRSASSFDDATWYIGDQGGFYTNGAAAASPTGNVRSVKVFGPSMYAFTASASLAPVGTIAAPTGGTLTGLPGLPTGTTAMQDFYMVQSGASGTAYDVLYVLSATNATTGAIQKYSLVAGSWTANGSYATDFGGFGLAARATAGAPGATLFATSGTGATAANTVRQLQDTAGFNTAINIVTANNITLYTSPAGTNVKGVDLVPSIPEPTSLGLGSVLFGALAMASRRRRNGAVA